MSPARAHGDDGEELRARSATMLPLRAALDEACEKVTTRVTSLSLVSYRGNDYSVPISYGHREVLITALNQELSAQSVF